MQDEAGYEYTLPNKEQIVEFHINDCNNFSTEINAPTKFEGELISLFINAPTALIDQWTKDGNVMFEEENEPSKAEFGYVLLSGAPMT